MSETDLPVPTGAPPAWARVRKTDEQNVLSDTNGHHVAEMCIQSPGQAEDGMGTTEENEENGHEKDLFSATTPQGLEVHENTDKLSAAMMDSSLPSTYSTAVPAVTVDDYELPEGACAVVDVRHLALPPYEQVGPGLEHHTIWSSKHEAMHFAWRLFSLTSGYVFAICSGLYLHICHP